MNTDIQPAGEALPAMNGGDAGRVPDAPHRLRDMAARLRALALVVVACALVSLGLPAQSLAAIQGDDLVGASSVNDRGLNITEAPAIDAKYGILCDADGRVLWARDADEHSAMASITKTMTAIVALENGSLDQKIEVSQNAASVGESTAGLQAGMELTLENLLNGLLVHSGNDAAVAIAEGIGGSQDKFVDMMNEKAESMGLKNTQFKDASGLDEDGHYSSAADLCVIIRYAMKNDTFREIVSKKKTTVDYGNGTTKSYITTNALLATWDDCIGVKTGYTSNAGECLASCAEEGGLELYAVVLGCSDEVQRFTDSYKLLSWGFAHYRQVTLASADDTLVDAPMSGFLDRTVKAGVESDVSAYVLDYDGDVSVDVKLVDIPDGVSEGDEIGTVTWRQGDNVVASVPLVAKENRGGPMPWTSVITATVRLVGLVTGDDCIAESKLYATTVAVERDDSSAGQVVSGKLEKAIRSYVAKYNASAYG